MPIMKKASKEELLRRGIDPDTLAPVEKAAEKPKKTTKSKRTPKE